MVNSTGADVAIINAGTFRSNCIHPKGPFTNKDLLRILPLFDQLCVLQVTGKNWQVFVGYGGTIVTVAMLVGSPLYQQVMVI